MRVFLALLVAVGIVSTAIVVNLAILMVRDAVSDPVKADRARTEATSLTLSCTNGEPSALVNGGHYDGLKTEKRENGCYFMLVLPEASSAAVIWINRAGEHFGDSQILLGARCHSLFLSRNGDYSQVNVAIAQLVK